ncbi:hypothetical protein KY284_023580 [Solanum tuberosum]|nr:hypothetical protein KY284_023580 [Solanum tuberosum]
MMHFRDRDSPHPLLEIVGDDQQNPNAKVLLLEVQAPAIGIFSLVSGTYDESFLLKECMHLPNLLILMDVSTIGVFPLLTLAMSATHLVTGNRLAKDDLHEVSVHGWVKFWFRGPIRYVESPQKVSKGAPLMTRKYVDWWTSQGMNTSKGNLRIILKKMKQDSTSMRLTLALKATSRASKVGHGSSDTNELHVSSDNGNDKTSNLVTPCDDISHMYASPNGVGRPNASSSPTLDLIKLYGDNLGNGIFADFTVDLNDLDVAAKYFHSSINDVMHSLEVVPPRKSPSTSSDDKKFPNQMMWDALCGYTKKISLGSLDGFIELESSIASTLEEIRKVDIIDVSSLEDLVENFFKSYAEYNTLRSSKMIKESHENALSDAQRRLDGAKLAHEKLDGSMGKLQATLTYVEKDLKALTSKKKKITALINKYQEKLYKSQENVTITEGEIYTIEADHMLSDDEVERLADLEGAVEKSR